MQQGAPRVATDNCFSCETTSFRLKVSFVDGALTVTLEDLVYFVVYSKVYREGESSQEIHSRVVLDDIFYSLTEACTSKAKFDQMPLEYQFGSVISKDEVPYYTIESEGKIIVYVSMMDLRKKKEIVFESCLCLQQIREMTDLQKLKQQTSLQKRRLLCQISNLKSKSAQLNQQLQQKTNELNTKTNEYQTKTNEFQQQLAYRTKRAVGEHRIFKRSNTYSQQMYCKTIAASGMEIYKIKVVKAPSRYVGFGVVDSKQNLPAVFYSFAAAVGYYWWYENQGHVYPSGGVQSIGFKEGEVVEMGVDLANKTIKWSVNGEVRATTTQAILGETTRTFVPYFELHYDTTQVHWVN